MGPQLEHRNITKTYIDFIFNVCFLRQVFYSVLRITKQLQSKEKSFIIYTKATGTASPFFFPFVVSMCQARFPLEQIFSERKEKGEREYL